MSNRSNVEVGKVKGSDAAPVPETKAECLALAQQWIGEKRSHWNAFATGDPSQMDAKLAGCAIADAAEVVKLSALYTMLPA